MWLNLVKQNGQRGQVFDLAGKQQAPRGLVSKVAGNNRCRMILIADNNRVNHPALGEPRQPRQHASRDLEAQSPSGQVYWAAENSQLL